MVLPSSPLTESEPPSCEAGAGPHAPAPGASPTALHPPVGHDAGVVGLLVLVHLQVALADEAFLLLKGADDADAQQGLIEVGINRGAADRLEALQLPGGGHVEPLGERTEPGVGEGPLIPSSQGRAGQSLDVSDPLGAECWTGLLSPEEWQVY